jgi:hypothetical protein
MIHGTVLLITDLNVETRGVPIIDEIKQFTNQRHNTHTFGLCETFLTEMVTNDMINIEGFTLENIWVYLGGKSGRHAFQSG